MGELSWGPGIRLANLRDLLHDFRINGDKDGHKKPSIILHSYGQ